ncbi:MAG: flavin reductase family protein [Chloroflexi bacterium]|nr:flavin reductase family protein [Chloroflexota bacterium]
MKRHSISIQDFSQHIFPLWADRWFVLTSGDLAAGKYNSMTISWGSLGNIWNMPFAQVFVRHTRYTFDFMEQYSTFSLCTFAEEYRDALNLLGSESGRNRDKIASTGLTVCPSQHIAAPSFEEANLCIECEKMYWQDMDAEHFIKSDIARHYSKRDYHRIYYGRILGIYQA